MSTSVISFNEEVAEFIRLGPAELVSKIPVKKYCFTLWSSAFVGEPLAVRDPLQARLLQSKVNLGQLASRPSLFP